MQRDFTYIDDVVEGVVRVAFRPASADPEWSASQPDPASSCAPYRIYNIGNHTPVELLRFVEILEEGLGRKALRELRPLQPGDVLASFAEISDLERDLGFCPSTSIETGLHNFVAWYREYYKV